MRGLVYKKIEPVHEDHRRSLIEVYNGEFTARQMKVLKINEAAVLGNHYHPYGQFFYMLIGEADYTFVDIETGKRQEIKMTEGDFVRIEKNIAHKSVMKAGNIMIEGNEQTYSSPEEDDLRYEIE